MTTSSSDDASCTETVIRFRPTQQDSDDQGVVEEHVRERRVSRLSFKLVAERPRHKRTIGDSAQAIFATRSNCTCSGKQPSKLCIECRHSPLHATNSKCNTHITPIESEDRTGRLPAAANVRFVSMKMFNATESKCVTAEYSEVGIERFAAFGHREIRCVTLDSRTKGACRASFPPKHATNSNCNAHTTPVDGDNIVSRPPPAANLGCVSIKINDRRIQYETTVIGKVRV